MRKLFALSVILGLILVNFNVVHSQEKKKDEDKSPYQFTIDYEVPHTPVKNQAKTGTCWCFSTVSYLESEALRLGKGELNLSEMFVVRHAYPHKAESYIRLHGNATFGQGGQSHDVIDQVKRYGIVPENVYPGMKIGEKQHNHSEMFGVLKAILDGVLRGKKLTPRWEDAFNSVLNIYLGKLPVDFVFQGKKYTPKSFAENYLRLNFDDYVELTSYQIYPFYEKCRLEVPDNWTFNDNYYNVPIDVLEKIMDHALKHGFSVVWDGDVTERDFSTRETGYAIVPEKDWEDKTKAERKKKITEPVKEKKVTQEMREITFDNFQTTDDHLMHIVGLAHDQKGTKFYYTKNSAGVEGRKFDGYLYLSRPFVRLKTVAIMVNKNAIPKKYRKKLGL